MGTAIVFVSGKGGTGKTTSVGAIASCLASRGHKTLCVDCDVGLRNLDMNLGLTDLTLLDLQDVLSGRAGLQEAAISHPDIENLFFLPAPAGVRPEDMDREAMAGLINEAKEEFEFCFIDAPAGIGPGFRLATAGADMAVVVANGDAPSLRDGQKVVSELAAGGFDNIRLLVNRLRPRLLAKTSANIDNIIDAVGARLLGIVTENEKVMLATNLEKPLILCDGNRAMQQFNRISRRLEGERIPLGKI